MTCPPVDGLWHPNGRRPSGEEAKLKLCWKILGTGRNGADFSNLVTCPRVEGVGDFDVS
jgi:hypothetical protein